MIRLAPIFLVIVGAPGNAQTDTICTDRPTKGNAPCTVPAGRLQIESDLWNFTQDTADGARSRAESYVSPVFKVGLTSSSDLQVGVPLWTTISNFDRGRKASASGVGDLTVRYKRRLTSTDEKLQVGIIPFIKLPTASRKLGNGAWEGGVIVPVTIGLVDGINLNLGPEVDILADTDGSGHHAQLVGLAALSTTLPKGFGASVELWTAQSLEQGRRGQRYSFDAAFTYQSRPDVLLDLGVNIGLNKQTPDTQLYIGASKLF